MFKKKTVLSHHAPIDHDEHHNILWNKREKKTRERERKRIVRRQDTKQPTNLFFISSARLSIHQKKKNETKRQAGKWHTLKKDKEEKKCQMCSISPSIE